MLAEAPATLQRLIARSNRISLPRCASPQVRLQRLRLSLCHARTVRVTYFALAPAEQLALQDLRHIRGGLSPNELAARYGVVRPLSQIAADIAPQSISETLLLHGFLLPRPATNRHPARFTVPLEVRRWLPRPLALPDHGVAPPPPLPPALRAATTILLSCAERPLPLRQDGQLGLESLRRLSPRLALLSTEELTALCRFVQPLLIDLGLLAPHGTAAALAPAGARFLALAPQTQLARLRSAWVGAPRVDEWLRPHLSDMRGIDWPLLRRRLLAWAAALPPQRLLDLDGLHDVLADALGPLADAHTHGYRPVDRVPWQPKRAAAVWDAALRGPLSWLGSIAWSDEQRYCFATPIARADVTDADDDPLQQTGVEQQQSDDYRLPAADPCALIADACAATADVCALTADPYAATADACAATADPCAVTADPCAATADACAAIADACAATADPCAVTADVCATTADACAAIADADDEQPLYRHDLSCPDHRPPITDRRPPLNEQRSATNDQRSTTVRTRYIVSQRSTTYNDVEPRDSNNPEPATDIQLATQNSKLKTQNSPHAWRYAACGEVVIPHAALDAAVLRLLPYARWMAADAQTTTYRIIPRRLALARRDGFGIDALAALLERQAGPLPQEWREWLAPAPSVQIVYGAVVTSEDPAMLDRAAQARSVRRHLKRLAPGIALADPKRVETLTRALGRQDLEVERRGAPQVARPSDLSAAECATLLAACAYYRQHAPDGVAPDSLAMLEERLRAGLPFDRRIAAALAPPAVPPSLSAAAEGASHSTAMVERGDAALLDLAPPLDEQRHIALFSVLCSLFCLLLS